MFHHLPAPAPLERYHENLSRDLDIAGVKVVLWSGHTGRGTVVRNKLETRDRLVKHWDDLAVGSGGRRFI